MNVAYFLFLLNFLFIFHLIKILMFGFLYFFMMTTTTFQSRGSSAVFRKFIFHFNFSSSFLSIYIPKCTRDNMKEWEIENKGHKNHFRKLSNALFLFFLPVHSPRPCVDEVIEGKIKRGKIRQ